jgi:diguanylate cyclase (GGDEF)-like protein
LVNDDPFDLTNLKQALPGYVLSAARDGVEGIALAKAEQPDLVLFDVEAARRDGFSTLARLCGDPETRRIPVILRASSPSHHDEAKGFDLGARDYIAKRTPWPILQRRVRAQIQQVEQLRALERLGFADPLTGIDNRRGFESAYAHEWRAAVREDEPLSLLVVDIDHFKRCNDQHGHAHGDEVLKAIARLIKSFARRSRDCAARIGGEEFALLLPDCGEQGALMLAEALRQCAAELIVPTDAGQASSVTLSIGLIGGRPLPGMEPQDFMERADRALYAAKANGRNHVVAVDGPLFAVIPQSPLISISETWQDPHFEVDRHTVQEIDASAA